MGPPRIFRDFLFSRPSLSFAFGFSFPPFFPSLRLVGQFLITHFPWVAPFPRLPCPPCVFSPLGFLLPVKLARDFLQVFGFESAPFFALPSTIPLRFFDRFFFFLLSSARTVFFPRVPPSQLALLRSPPPIEPSNVTVSQPPPSFVPSVFFLVLILLN